MVNPRSFLLGALATLAAAAACSSSDRPAASQASSSSSSSASSSASSASGGPADEAGILPGNPRLCEPLPQKGFDLDEVGSYASAPAKPYGGTIEPGTYILTVLDFDRGPPPPGPEGSAPPTPTGKAGRATVYITASSIRFNEARGKTGALPPDGTRGFYWKTTATSIELTPECPEAGPAKAIGYTGGGNELVLFVDASHRETYSRQP